MITLRKQPSGCVMVLLCLLYAILLGIYIWAVRVCLNPAQGGGMEPYVGYIILAIATIMIPVPVIISMVKRYSNARIKYELTEDEMRCYKGRKITRRIPRDNIRLFGCFTVGRSAWIFFCTASDEEINNCASEYWEKRILAFNRNQLDQLEKTSFGIWQIKVAIYLQFASKAHKGNVITLEFQNQNDIIAISTLWRMEPFLAGSYAIEHSEYYSGKGLY